MFEKGDHPHNHECNFMERGRTIEVECNFMKRVAPTSIPVRH
jgi:hypothetical protein